MLEIKHLSKIYDDGTHALKDVSFSVQDGEFLVIIGLSGSGKSTLLRCINRLIEPSGGQVLWNGQDVTAAGPGELRRIRHRVGMLFHHINLVTRLPRLTNVLPGRPAYVAAVRSLLGRRSRHDRAAAL